MHTEPVTVALLPLDERPANTRYPAHIAAIAGAQLALPPLEALPFIKRPADREKLTQWLTRQAGQTDSIVASIDLLGYGGLINSRISDDEMARVLGTIESLTLLRQPGRTVFAFNVIERISNANDATEEPDYWAEYGTRLYDDSRELDQGRSERLAPSERSSRFDVARHDWLTRRARNHAVNLAMLRAAALGKFDLLVISSDDTSPVGLSARERKHLEFWRDALWSTPGPAMLNVGAGQVLMYPGADDVGSALVARMINHKRNHSPTVFVHYADEEMRNNVAPYEDRPIHVTVETQIMAVGAQQVMTPEAADVIVTISPPFERRERDPHWSDHDPDVRRRALTPMVQRIARWLDEGRRVAVADVAFPNGAEPVFVELLLEHTPIAKLTSFGGWNTAGNTLGTVLGAACVPPADDHARQVALAHHLLEDWGYQSSVRSNLGRWLSETFGDGHIPVGHLAEATAFTADHLQPIAGRIGAAGLPCTVKNVRHPWHRTFEVDFDLD